MCTFGVLGLSCEAPAGFFCFCHFFFFSFFFFPLFLALSLGRGEGRLPPHPNPNSSAASSKVNTVSGIATDFSGTKAERVTKLHKMCTRQKKH